jgi:hypothetical protein
LRPRQVRPVNAIWLGRRRDAGENATAGVASPQTIAATEAGVESKARSGRDNPYPGLAPLINHGDCHIASDQGKNGMSVRRRSSRRSCGTLIGSVEDGHRLRNAAYRASQCDSSRHCKAFTTGVGAASNQSKRLPVREPGTRHDTNGVTSEPSSRKARRHCVPLPGGVEPPACGGLDRGRGVAFAGSETANRRDRHHSKGKDLPGARRHP